VHWKVLDHPPYNLGLSLFDFHVFSPLKKVLKGHRFRFVKDVKAVMIQWFQQQLNALYLFQNKTIDFRECGTLHEYEILIELCWIYLIRVKKFV
jgi:hypothetical protein